MHLAGCRVQPQVPQHQRRGAARRPAPHQRAHPGEQLLALERLDEIVVGAGVESLDTIVEIGPGREDQDRDVVVLAQSAKHLDAVELGQPEVEDHQVRHELGRRNERLVAVARAADLVSLLAQRAAQDVGDLLVVLDDEDPPRGCF